MSGPLYMTKYRKWGDSFTMIFPRHVREKLRLMNGDILGMRVYGTQLVIERIPTEGIAIPRGIPASILPPELRPQGG
ncbi:MAG: AbrB/MazE/SpoVT family DNA-binding domain-containing protein [Terriglobales bacterium]